MELSKVVEQIGPDLYRRLGDALSGDPELGADLACRAASVSHDGELSMGHR